MITENKSEIETVKDQTLFLRGIYDQLAKSGKFILEADDMIAVDELSQTLNIFRMYLTILKDNERLLRLK